MKHVSILVSMLAGVPAIAQDSPLNTPEMTLENRTSLRCSAAFAIVAHGQDTGNAAALEYPPIGPRGREFFVRFSARLMDDTGMTRDQVAGLLSSEAKELRKNDSVDEIMPACLLLLDASGL